jgi:hypothetical protein
LYRRRTRGLCAALLGLSLGCSDDPPEPPKVNLYLEWNQHCEDAVADKRAKFIIDCATAANPKADEEGEDLVEQCEETSENVLCARAPRACKEVEGALPRRCVWCSEIVNEPELKALCPVVP